MFKCPQKYKIYENTAKLLLPEKGLGPVGIKNCIKPFLCWSQYDFGTANVGVIPLTSNIYTNRPLSALQRSVQIISISAN